MANIGDRVGAIRNVDKDVVYFYGYGTFAGYHETITISPKIELDNGSVVYGYECWWASEEAVKKMIGNRKVIVVAPETV